MYPTVGLALLNFSIVQAPNVALVYTIDCYRPIAGAVTLTTMACKVCLQSSIFFLDGRLIFLLLRSASSFLFTLINPWVQKSAYVNAYGAMTGTSAAILTF
jgi:hypothetical protein